MTLWSKAGRSTINELSLFDRFVNIDCLRGRYSGCYGRRATLKCCSKRERDQLMDWNMLLNAERPRASTSSGDHREQFERDYDRAVFSSPVKRLQDKAQVFPLEPHDSVRTRLTHSLEVSSVARGLVQRVCKDFLLKTNEIKDGQD